jgi:hypothetical protein
MDITYRRPLPFRQSESRNIIAIAMNVTCTHSDDTHPSVVDMKEMKVGFRRDPEIG